MKIIFKGFATNRPVQKNCKAKNIVYTFLETNQGQQKMFSLFVVLVQCYLVFRLLTTSGQVIWQATSLLHDDLLHYIGCVMPQTAGTNTERVHRARGAGHMSALKRSHSVVLLG